MGASIGSSILFMLLLSLSLQHCHSSATPHNAVTITVVGATSCTDCAEKNLKSEQAFQGLKLAVKCKTAGGEYDIKGTSELDNKGEFTVELPGELLTNEGELKDECIAQLHDTTNMPCPDASKLVFKSKENNKHVFAGKLSFSSATCASEFLGKIPKLHHLYKYFHKKPLPKLPFPKKHFFPPTPIYKLPVVKPPVYKPPVYKPPLEKPLVYNHPVYKTPLEKPPVYKPPVYKPSLQKPLTYENPVYKPPVYKPPIYKPPLEKSPVYKPPVFKKPFPPIFKKPLPDVYVKPLPPTPKLPPIYKKPVPPTNDHTFFKKPFFKYPPYKKWPPVPPFHP